MNYFINGMSGRHISNFPVDLVDFTDYSACHALVEANLKRKAKSFVAMKVVLEHDEDPDEDREIVLQYRYSGTPGKLQVLIIDSDEEVIVNEDLPIFVSEKGLVAANPEDLDCEEAVEEIVKIILDYGKYIVLGVQWGAFLMKENHDGTLDQYFDELHSQEIH